MKSLNKYVPVLVFLLGLSLLIFSVRTFFRPSAFRHMTPIANTTPPPQATTAPAVQFRPAKKAPPPISRTDSREELRRAMKKPAENFLTRAGLKMSIPDGLAFVEETDGDVQVLVGASEAGKPDFYFFSTKGKHKVERAEKYLKDYFADEMTMTVRGKPEVVYNRGSVGEITHFKGSTGRGGGEFQAYFFNSHKASRSHMLVLMNKQFLKAPARVRELVNSIKPSDR